MEGDQQKLRSSRAKWWHRADRRVVCDLCPRSCSLTDGQRGFCFVRQNLGGEMVLTTYGRSTGFCIDPVEKKPLNHFLPGNPILSFGTAGCNLGCKFCQNWNISKAREIEILSETATPEMIADRAKALNCPSIAFTYNDPIVWAEYAIDSAIAAHERGLKTVAVTAGYIAPDARREFFQHIDAANVDLKGFTEHFYRDLTLSHLEPVLDTLKWLRTESKVWIEITNLIIPGHNDALDEVARMCEWISANLGSDVPLHFSAFHPDFRLLAAERTPLETLQRARNIALAHGLNYPYVGNCHDAEGQTTFCPKCKASLIVRDWYTICRYELIGNRCGNCGQIVPGLFADAPGEWGAKRQGVTFSNRTSI